MLEIKKYLFMTLKQSNVIAVTIKKSFKSLGKSSYCKAWMKSENQSEKGKSIFIQLYLTFFRNP
jgi:hypothetical protein